MALSEIILLFLSLRSIGSWKENNDVALSDASSRQDFDYSEIASQSRFESKSLYDLTQNFPLDKEIICPTKDARFRYPGECTRYITCWNFQAHIRSCPPGMQFDPKYNHCRLGFLVDCNDDSSSQFFCPNNEVYTTCGTSCERTCDNFNKQIECNVECIEGCSCSLGYVRNRNGKCVKPVACENANSLHFIFNKE